MILPANMFQLIGILVDGDEVLLALGETPNDARHFGKLHLADLPNDLGVVRFSLRQWIPRGPGGYWQPVNTWRNGKGVRHVVAA